MTPDQRDPDVVVRSERGLLDIVAAQAPTGVKVRLAAPAAEAGSAQPAAGGAEAKKQG